MKQLLILLIMLLACSVHAQQELPTVQQLSDSLQPEQTQHSEQPLQQKSALQPLLHTQHQTVMFWNVENAFWPADDPATADEDFTPEGSRHWTMGRLKQKLTNLAKVLLAAGDGMPPMVVGLAEVEGDSVMQYWLKKTAMYRLNYRYLLSDSADHRGIQTALLYQPTDFRPLLHTSYSIPLSHGQHSTRQLFHVAGRLVNADTLDLIIAHLPSQYGGARQSQEARSAAHLTLMHVADSIALHRRSPHVIIMGDMNEAPSRRRPWWQTDSGLPWVNLMLPLQQSLPKHPSQYGSHKYQGEWTFLDQFIVLQPDLMPTDTAQVTLSQARSFSMPFMLTPDDSHLGHRPLRSFYGFQYEAGFSDHLPVMLDLDVRF